MLPGYNSSMDKRMETQPRHQPRIPQSPNNKHFMQNLYKNQLDQMLKEINSKKQLEKKQKQMEKLEFNERAQIGKQNEKGKEIAYKNYYKMLLENQDQYQSSYVSPYSIRDNMKEQLISHSVFEGQKRMKEVQINNRRRRAQLKNAYKQELMKQLDERRAVELRSRDIDRKEKEDFYKYRKMPNELNKYEREKHIEEMEKYREDLDKMKEQNRQMKRKTQSEHHNLQIPADQHNALINPLPYNIQNPYILKQMRAYKQKQLHLSNVGGNVQNFHYSRN